MMSVNRLLESDRILIATDFDGTLCPLASAPELVELPPETRNVLQQLSAHPRCLVAIITGRRIGDVCERVGLPLVYGGNHGLEIRGPGLAFEHAQAASLAPLLSACCDELRQQLRPWRGAWVEDKHLTATVHFRQVAQRDQHSVALRVRAYMTKYGRTFGLRSGHRALDIHPRVGWNKGAALCHIREQLGWQDAACLILGDDRTDETMFRACPDAVSVRVGRAERTSAVHSVSDHLEVRRLLATVAAGLSAPAVAQAIA